MHTTTPLVRFPVPFAVILLRTKTLLSVIALSTPPHIHICNLAAQTGASLFLQYNAPPYHPSFLKPEIYARSKFQIPPAPWIYNKTEHMSVRDLTLSKQITHLISEVNPESEEGLEMKRDWGLVTAVSTRSRLVLSWRMLKGDWPYEHEDKLWIYERIWSQVG
jgi:alpha-1,6-mannosyltransferase